MENITLFNGQQMPYLGLGTWHHGPHKEMQDAIKFSINNGYRHIDCAYIYQNEKEVGEVFKEVIGEDKAVKRSEIFIAGKLWNTEHAADRVEAACRSSLADLGLDYFDTYIVHWPSGFIHGHGNLPRTEDGYVRFSGVSIEETWKAMEKLVDIGLTKSIGLSNYNSKQVLRVLECGRIRPAVLQVESNPRFNNEALRRFCSCHSIAMVAFSPFGSPDLPWGKKLPHILADLTINSIANKLAKSPAQVVLRWQIQRGIGVIPKSVFPSELLDNLGIWGWTLDNEDMKVVDSINTGDRKIVPVVNMANGEVKIRDLEDQNYPFNFVEE